MNLNKQTNNIYTHTQANFNSNSNQTNIRQSIPAVQMAVLSSNNHLVAARLPLEYLALSFSSNSSAKKKHCQTFGKKLVNEPTIVVAFEGQSISLTALLAINGHESLSSSTKRLISVRLMKNGEFIEDQKVGDAALQLQMQLHDTSREQLDVELQMFGSQRQDLFVLDDYSRKDDSSVADYLTRLQFTTSELSQHTHQLYQSSSANQKAALATLNSKLNELSKASSRRQLQHTAEEPLSWQQLETFASEFMAVRNSTTSVTTKTSENIEDKLCQDPPIYWQANRKLAALKLSSVRNLQKADAGIYQLIACDLSTPSMADAIGLKQQQSDATNSNDSDGKANGNLDNNSCSQTSFQLHIVNDIPTLSSTFNAKLLRQDDKLSIKCVASAKTLPQITWYVDDTLLSESVGLRQLGSSFPSSLTNNEEDLQSQQPQRLDSSARRYSGNMGGGGSSNDDVAGDSDILAVTVDDTNQRLRQVVSNGKLRVGDFVTQDGKVHSFVNISKVSISDAGYYKCVANNGLHSVEHEQRIDVLGGATVARPMANLSALAGTLHVQVKCPFAGYPIAGVEWFFRPASQSSMHNSVSSSLIDGNVASVGDNARMRVRRQHAPRKDSSQELEDEWLLQANTGQQQQQQRRSSQTNKNKENDSDDDNDEPIFDYEQLHAGIEFLPAVVAANTFDTDEDSAAAAAADETADYETFDSLPSSEYADVDLTYLSADSDTDTDIYADTFQQNNNKNNARVRRAPNSMSSPAASSVASNPNSNANSYSPLKLPQSRRHQIHANGTLSITQLSTTDDGFYKCRVLGHSQHHFNNQANAQSTGNINSQNNQPAFVDSNEFKLTVLQPPVISPFTSPENLREGMRNFLTCSVIEGDAPMRITWLKDNVRLTDEAIISNKLRVETTNEFTSTLYFLQVDFSHNGNYTCV